MLHATEPEREYLLTNDAARVLGVAPQTVRMWERSGRLHAVRTGGGVRLFTRADVTALADRLSETRRSAKQALNQSAQEA